MFKLFSKSKPGDENADLSRLVADMHSHLLPGIDDGSPDMETSLELIRGMSELGYKKLITTPHILGDMFRNTPEIISEKLEAVRAAVKSAGIPVEINAAAEYFLDDHVAGLLRKNKPLLTISGKMVLVEFSMALPSMNVKDMLFEMQMQGYQPVIAHPERYTYLDRNKSYYDELKDIGCLFQLNLLALTNYYGKSCSSLAQYLCKKGYYNLVGSDLHHVHHLAELGNPALQAPLTRLLETGNIKNDQL